MKTAVVIGAGIGGLGAAIRLAKEGFETHVIEANGHAGGKMNNLQMGDYRFDMGPSVFTGPAYIQELFDLCGEDFSNFKYTKLPHSFSYFFPDGQNFTLSAKREEVLETFQKELQEDPLVVARYLDKSRKNYELIAPLFIEKSLHRFKKLLGKKLWKALRHIPSYRLNSTMHEENQKTFTNPKSVQIFNRFATYNGSDPYKTPAMLNMIQHLEINEGVYLPDKGMVNIAQTLQELAEKSGVIFHFHEKATQILVEKNTIKGVKTTRTCYDADVVFSNMDVSMTYDQLLPSAKRPEKSLNQEKSSSAMVFYWGIQQQFSELGIHNILFSTDYQNEFNDIFETFELPKDPTIYINITSKAIPSDAPADGENWFTMINVPRNVGQDWGAYRKIARKRIIEKINHVLDIDLEPLIMEEFVMDPVFIEETYSGKFGSIYGNSSNNKYAAFYRHPNFSKRIKGLYFVGVSVHPGGGIPLALNSAKIAVECLKEDGMD
jgi:phytoene desaturase